MQSPFSFPDWVPWWAQLLIAVAGVLLTLALALMPFSVFGVKSRLEAVEARLDEIQGEIRSLALRLPEPSRRSATDDEPLLRAQPPIPPAAWRAAQGDRTRAEPRLDRNRL